MVRSFDILGGILVCALALASMAGSAEADLKKITFYSFRGGKDGTAPQATLVVNRQGNFYGTTLSGGASGGGTVFKLAPNRTKTIIHSFSGGNNDGDEPLAGVAMDKKGNLYGTTSYGGQSQQTCNGGCGTVFKLAPDGTETVYSFTGENGSDPQAAVIVDDKGNVYGTTYYGGNEGGYGTVFELSSDGTETILHSFGFSDGALPAASLIMDKQGNLYGTTS
jgi:uncharacterized repeat protein (TIGR03803 family)